MTREDGVSNARVSEGGEGLEEDTVVVKGLFVISV